jgi:hypothetical protein
MRIDPTSVFFHSIASVPLRACLAWLVGTLGAFTPLFIQHGFDAIEFIGYQFMFFPIYLFLIALFSGWWGFVALPLLLFLMWRLVEFLRNEGFAMELFWIYLLSYLIGIRASGDDWPIAAVLAGIGMIFIIRQQLRCPKSAL